MRKKSVLKIVIALLAVMNLVVCITGIVAYFDIVEIPFLDSVLGHFQTEDVDEESELEAEAPSKDQDDEKTLTEDENDSKQPVSEEWKQAYLDLMKKPGGDNVKYKLVYIDDDDIPELYILGNTVAQGDMLCTYREGEVWGIHMYNYGLSYLERQNSFCDSGGRMDSYFDYVWHKGEFGAEDNSRVECDAEGNPIYVYNWDGEEVSKKEYEESLEEAYDETKAKLGYVGAFGQDEMMEIIERMGMSSSVMEDQNSATERMVASGECALLETVYFKGDAPEFNVDEEQFDIGTDRKSTFAWDTVKIYYPANNPTWTEEKLQDEYGGWLTWRPWKP